MPFRVIDNDDETTVVKTSSKADGFHVFRTFFTAKDKALQIVLKRWDAAGDAVAFVSRLRKNTLSHEEDE